MKILDAIERIVEKIKYYRWSMSYKRIENATIIPSGDPILIRIVFDAIVQLVAHIVAYVALAILLVLIVWELFIGGWH